MDDNSTERMRALAQDLTDVLNKHLSNSFKMNEKDTPETLVFHLTEASFAIGMLVSNMAQTFAKNSDGEKEITKSVVDTIEFIYNQLNKTTLGA